MIAPAACAAAGLLNLLGRPREDSGLVRGVTLEVLQVTHAPGGVILHQRHGEACICSDLRAGEVQMSLVHFWQKAVSMTQMLACNVVPWQQHMQLYLQLQALRHCSMQAFTSSKFGNLKRGEK